MPGLHRIWVGSSPALSRTPVDLRNAGRANLEASSPLDREP